MLFSRPFQRLLHSVPRLPGNPKEISGLMSADQFKMAWTDQQSYLLSKLSLKTAETDMEAKTPFQVALTCSKDTLKQDIGFYASMAHNNHLFFDQLTGSARKSIEIKPQLLKAIERSFGSLDDLRSSMLLAADSMDGNGFVFLVEDSNKQLSLKVCNNGGNPYVYSQNQSLDLNGPISKEDLIDLKKMNEMSQQNVKDYSLPLLVINVWEHTYLLDYGINGKADYLEKLWDSINWDVVNKRYFTV